MIRRFVAVTVVMMSVTNYALASQWKSREVTCEIDGIVFEYNLPPGSGRVNVIPPRIVHLKPGGYKMPFTTSDAIFPSISVGHTTFSACVVRSINPKLTVDQLPSEARAGREAKYMFYPREKPTQLEYRNVDGRRWLVTTHFDDPGKRIVTNRTFWAVEDGFQATLAVNFDESAPLTATWRAKRLRVLDELVSGFRMRRR